MDPRISERRREVRAERQHSRRRRTIVLLVLAAVLGAAYAVERSPLVELREVRVEGTDRLQPDQVRAAANLRLGTSTLRLGLGDARERVERLPLVRTARVRRLDALTVVVEVNERRPILVVRSGQGSVLVDNEGIVIATGTQGGLPVVIVRGALPEPGERISGNAGAGNAHAVHVHLPGPLRTEVVRYVARSVAGLELVLDSGVRIRFGAADRIDEKARSIGALLDRLAGAPVHALDVRAPTNPVIVP